MHYLSRYHRYSLTLLILLQEPILRQKKIKSHKNISFSWLCLVCPNKTLVVFSGQATNGLSAVKWMGPHVPKSWHTW